MDILFNGNKPQKKTYPYSVKENNNSNVITFILDKEQENLDLSALSCFVKVHGSEIDKDVPSVEVVGDKIHVIWTLLRKHTDRRVIDVQLQFEGVGDVVWQSEILNLVLSDTIKADKYIENKYPSVLTNHEERITSLENGGQPTKKSKEFVFVKRGKNLITLKSNATILITGANKEYSKGQWIHCYGTKLGNKPYISVEKGNYLMREFLSQLFKLDFSVVNKNEELDYSKTVLFPMVINSEEAPFLYEATIDFVADYEDDFILRNVLEGTIKIPTKTFGKCAKKFMGMLEDVDDLVYQTKFMVKFVEDYEKVRLPKGAEKWKGNMARNWLELQLCFAYNKSFYGDDQIKVYVLPIEKRFA